MDCSRVVSYFLDPDTFFREHAAEKPGLLLPFIIVVTIGAANLVTGLLHGTFGYNPFLRALLFSESPVPVILIPLVIWFLLSGFLYSIGNWMSGTGTFLVTLRNTGWCFLPVAVFSIVFHGSLYIAGAAAASHFQEGLQFIIFLFLYAAVSFFWTGYLLTFAVKHAHGLNDSRAFNAVVTAFILIAVLLFWLEFLNLGYHTAGPVEPFTD